ncbi:type IV toxin-antitoxin system AbiEi family antitoxin domain-containing protein [Isoptericola haloaureus]
MRHLSTDYYAGWLTAAALHGAAHQAPQVFQVATSRDVRDRVVGRTRFRHRTRSHVTRVATLNWPTRSGTARVSTVETTLLDLATDVDAAGGLDNAATVLVELSENDAFHTDALVEMLGLFPAAAFRRLGWILENFGGAELDELAARVVPLTRTPSRLDPGRPQTGPLDDRWNIRLNADVEPDL